jgi:hypothetical protein
MPLDKTQPDVPGERKRRWKLILDVNVRQVLRSARS